LRDGSTNASCKRLITFSEENRALREQLRERHMRSPVSLRPTDHYVDKAYMALVA